MACCGRTRTATATVFVVKRPGQPDVKAYTEAAAQQLIRGVAGASYRRV